MVASSADGCHQAQASPLSLRIDSPDRTLQKYYWLTSPKTKKLQSWFLLPSGWTSGLLWNQCCTEGWWSSCLCVGLSLSWPCDDKWVFVPFHWHCYNVSHWQNFRWKQGVVRLQRSPFLSWACVWTTVDCLHRFIWGGQRSPRLQKAGWIVHVLFLCKVAATWDRDPCSF